MDRAGHAVDTRVARPLIEGLSTETVVTDPSGAALFDIAPIGFDASLRKAVAAETAEDRPPTGVAEPMRHHGSMRRRLAVALVTAVGCSLAGTLLPSIGSATDAPTSVGEKALGWAVQQEGTAERGTTNCSPTIDRWERDMGLKLPPCRVWCGAFVHQAYLRAGVRLSSRLIDPHRSFDDAVAGRRHLRQIPISAIRAGDIVFYKFREGVRASHLAIARSKPKSGKLDTVEGNTSNAVRLETRGTQFIVLAARVTA